MKQQPSPEDKIVLTGVFEGWQPDELFAMWVVPDLVTKWWPNRAEVHSGQGGSYQFSWPDRGWILEGTYTAWDPGRHLGFTWHWNFDPDDGPPLHVDLLFDTYSEGGTCLTITQGPYADTDADRVAKQEHVEGWIHFCMRLAGLRPGDLADGDTTCAMPEIQRTGD